MISFWVVFGLLLKPIGLPFAILAASGIAVAAALTAVQIPKLLKKSAASIALWVVTSVAKDYSVGIQSEGIDERRGSVIIRLGIGSYRNVALGDRFDVVNNASRQIWGRLEAIEVDDNSCVCDVFDRINEDFGQELESRMRRDPSPPEGVIFSREMPADLLEYMRRLIRNWGG